MYIIICCVVIAYERHAMLVGLVVVVVWWVCCCCCIILLWLQWVSVSLLIAILAQPCHVQKHQSVLQLRITVQFSECYSALFEVWMHCALQCCDAALHSLSSWICGRNG